MTKDQLELMHHLVGKEIVAVTQSQRDGLFNELADDRFNDLLSLRVVLHNLIHAER